MLICASFKMHNEPISKGCKLKLTKPLPIITENGKISVFKGKFNGFSVVIDDEQEMTILTSLGFFGKATLSKGYPEFHKSNPQIVRRRVFENRKRCCDVNSKPEKVAVVPDDDGISYYFTNLKPEYQFDFSKIVETVNLSLEEAFFLVAAVQCLRIYYEDKEQSLKETWELFKRKHKHFITDYITYYYFRTKNWIVKSGIKFGGDYLLYKQGPLFYHASYVVVNYVVDEQMREIEEMNKRRLKNTDLVGLNRLCETSGKELLILKIKWPSTLSKDSFYFDDLQKLSVEELTMKRWVSLQERKQTA